MLEVEVAQRTRRQATVWVWPHSYSITLATRNENRTRVLGKHNILRLHPAHRLDMPSKGRTRLSPFGGWLRGVDSFRSELQFHYGLRLATCEMCDQMRNWLNLQRCPTIEQDKVERRLSGALRYRARWRQQ